MTFLLIFSGLVALVGGAELLVRGASRLARSLGISSLVVGLTVVAFGTSAPELTVSITSLLSGKADIAVGNVVGSNIFNVLFILGISSLIIPLSVHHKLIRVDVPLMIATSLVVWLMAVDGVIGRIEGGVLFIGLVTYTVRCIAAGRKESPEAFSEHGPGAAESDAREVLRSSPKGDSVRRLTFDILSIAGGLLLLVMGSNWLINGATTLAQQLGISELIIGLTIVACGTSLPEAATSIVAAIRGERDIAVGNVVGSNLFNLLGVLGLSSLVSAEGVLIQRRVLHFDLPVMVVVSIACLPIFFTGRKIDRWEGVLFVGGCLLYNLASILGASM